MSELTSKMPPVPVDKTPHVNIGAFEIVNCVKAYNKIPVFEYKSKNTDLTVIIAEVEGPVVNGYFCLATEAFDDDGLPHTLEHLIFLGSEQYPYKGVLDLLANRCLAHGTNAWTDTDHTCYTMETAGSEGFLALMPIFLEHILYPVLTEEGFVTEVHHVTPDGDDAGVVYCEMQGRENTAESRLHVNLARAMYPGHCGYSSETGGIMKNLRESTTNEKVRDYHKQFYRPENLKVIITGQIKHDDILRAIAPLENKIILKGDRGPFQRPWQNPVAPLQESKDLVIKYPTDEENNGLFCVAWRGPSAVTDQYSLVALGILLKYLTDSSTYLLPKEFIEIDDPYASNIAHNLLENAESCIYLMFEDVPLEKLSEVKPKLEDILRKTVENEDINMERMHSIINRTKLEHLSNTENNPHITVAYACIGHILYGNTKTDLEERMDPVSSLNKLVEAPKSFWLSLLSRYMVNNQYVAIQCVPSKDEQITMEREEKERVEKQREILGRRGLAEKASILEKALEYNGRQPPQEMLTSVPVPTLRSINFHSITRYTSDDPPSETIDLTQTPVFTYFNHAQTEFAYIYALLDTKELPEESRLYLPLMLEALFDSPIKKEGKIIPFEEVVEQLNRDTVSYSTSIGSGAEQLFKCGAYSHSVFVMLQVEAMKYLKGVEWLKDVLYNVVFTPERLKIIAAKMNNAIAQAKRSGRDVATYAMKELRYVTDSNVHGNGILVQNKFLTDAAEALAGDKSQDFIINCENVWDILTTARNTTLHISGNFELLSKPEEALKLFLPLGKPSNRRKLSATPDRLLLKSESDLSGCIIGIGSLESSYFLQNVDSICSYEDPDLPALMLYLQYLIQAEGPMWKQIRGKGYAYGYTMLVKPYEGLLYLIFSRATNVVGAYEEAREILQTQIKSQKWDNTLIESAKSSLIFELIETEKTVGDVIGMSIICYLRDVEFKYNRTLSHLVHNVTVDDLNRVGEKYLGRLFEPNRVKTAIVSVPGKIQMIFESFKKFDLNLEVFPSLEESFLKP